MNEHNILYQIHSIILNELKNYNLQETYLSDRISEYLFQYQTNQDFIPDLTRVNKIIHGSYDYFLSEPQRKALFYSTQWSFSYLVQRFENSEKINIASFDNKIRPHIERLFMNYWFDSTSKYSTPELIRLLVLRDLCLISNPQDGYIPGFNPSNNKTPCKEFTGRKKELEQVISILKGNNKLILSGVAGIGKTQFVKALLSTETAKQYSFPFIEKCLCSYGTDFQKTIEALPFPITTPTYSGSFISNFNEYIHYLEEKTEKSLLVIDHVAVDDLNNLNYMLDKLSSLKMGIIIITQSHIQHAGFQNYPLGKLEENDLCSLVNKILPGRRFNTYNLCKLLELLDYHTYSLSLAAKLMHQDSMSLESMIVSLEEFRLTELSTKSKFKHIYDNKQLKIIGHLVQMASLPSNLEEKIHALSLIASNGLSTALLNRC